MSASDHSFPLLRISETVSQSFKGKRKKQPHGDWELLHPAPFRTPPAFIRIREWLSRLTVRERECATAVENSWATSMLRQMLARKLRDGEVVFRPIGQERNDSAKLEDYYETLRPYEPHSPADQEFEQHLRLTDSSQYLDTLTISLPLLSDLPRFLHLSDTLTAGAAFSAPCYVVWDQPSKSWLRECPQWTAKRILTLSQFALALIEKHCWARFCEATKTDPRAPGETQTYVPRPLITGFASVDSPAMAELWAGLDADQRYLLAGEMKMLIDLYVREKEVFERNSCHNFEIASLECCYSASFLSMFENHSGYYKALRNEMQHYMIQASVDVMRKAQARMPAEEFVDFLIKTPLERSGTIFDYVARNVAAKIQQKVQKQIIDNLLNTEESFATNAQIKQKTHKKKKKKGTSNASTTDSPCIKAAPSPKIAENERKITSEEVANAAIDAILQLVATHIEENQFETVKVASRKKTDKRKAIVTSLSKEKCQTSPKQAVQQLTKPAVSTSKITIKWPNEDAQNRSVVIPTHFPPLSGYAISPQMTILSREIDRFSKQIAVQMAVKSPIISRILSKLKEVITFIFPSSTIALFGSFATGLALPSSDIDLAVVGADVRDAGQRIIILEEVMRAYIWVANANGIVSATTPVLKLEIDSEFFQADVRELIQVDISIEDLRSHPHRGVATCNWVQSHLALYPQTRDCVLVLKQLLHGLELNSAYYGGLSSYSVLLWTAAYVRKNREVRNPGELLLGVLRFYGEEFDPKITIIDNSESEERFAVVPQINSFCETIDPLRSDNNTTKGAFRIGEIQEVFRKAYNFLKESTEANPLGVLLTNPELIKV